MSFSYNAGSTTPNLAGLIEVGSIRINDGTFELHGAPGLLWGSAGLSNGISPLSNDHGGYAGTPFYTPREFSIVGEISVPALADLWGALDLLYATFNLSDTALKTLTLNTSGWAATRQIAARVAGDIQITSPADKNGHLALRRQFTIPMEAPDPRIYSTTLHTVTVTSGGTSLTNAGNMPTPFTAKFNSSQTQPLVLSDPNSKTITFVETVSSGYVLVNTRDATSATATAATGGGTNKFAKVTDWSAATIPPGTTTWTATKAGGAGATEVSFRDAWA